MTLHVDRNGTVLPAPRGSSALCETPPPRDTKLLDFGPIANRPGIREALRLLLNGALNKISLTVAADADQPSMRVQGRVLERAPAARRFVICLEYACAASVRETQDCTEAALERMAVWLHEEPAQLIAAARLSAYQLRHSISEPDAQTHIAGLQQLLDAAAAAVRNVLQRLVPNNAHAGCLHRVLQDTARQVASRYGMQVDFSGLNLDRPFSNRVTELAVRCLHEGLLNAYKHGGAKRAHAQALANEDGLTLVVTNTPRRDTQADDDMKPLQGGFGLTVLRRWAGQLGGRLRLDVDPTGASPTRFVLSVPDPLLRSSPDSGERHEPTHR